MNLRTYLAMLRRRWLSIAALTIAGIALGIVATVLAPSQYRTSTQLFLAVGSQQSLEKPTGANFAQQRMESYPDIVTSARVLAPVIRTLGLNITPAQLAGSISATNPPDTVLLDIVVVGTDPGQITLIADAVALESAKTIELIETPGGAASSPVKVSVTNPAIRPSSAFSPDPIRNVGLGLIVGFGLGLGLALLREQLDNRITTSEAVASITGAVELGVVPFAPDAGERPLIEPDKQSARGEAFRRIRTNLRFIDVDNPPKVFVVTSSIPGEGKSTSTCNLALTMAIGGSSVCLVEADLRAPRASGYLGLDNSIGLTDVLTGERDLDSVLVRWGRGLFTVVPSGPMPPNPTELLASGQMTRLLAKLREQFDLVILDVPPLLPVTDAAVVARITDGAIMVVRHGKTTREELEHSYRALDTVGARVLGTVLNFAPRTPGSYGYGYGYGYGGESGDRPKDAKQATARAESVTPG